MAERKLDIFKTLNAANSRNREYYEKLSEDEKKGFAPTVVARWMSGTSDAGQVMFINEFLNPYLFSLYKHPQLLWQLMTACNSGRNQRYSWNKLPNKKETGKSNTIQLLCRYLQCNTSHAADALDILTRDQVLDIADHMGLQPEEVAKVKKEMKGGKDAETAAESSKSSDPIAQLLEF